MSYGYGLHREPSVAESTENTPIRYQLCKASKPTMKFAVGK